MKPMKPFQILAPLAAWLAVALAGTAAQALFHQWNFTEFFSNADGTVQFIELQCLNFNGENVATAGTVRSASTGKSYTFPANLPSTQTALKFMFVATDGFESKPGAVTPDFSTLTPLPANFFNPAGDTITLTVPPFGVVDTKMFTSVPTDGVGSRQYPSNTEATNMHTNFAGMTGSVNLVPPPEPTGDYNGNGIVDAADFTVWRDTFGQPVAMDGDGADGNQSGMIDDGDYTYWKERFGDVVPDIGAAAGNSSAGGSPPQAAVPEPATWVLVAVLVMLLPRRTRALLP